MTFFESSQGEESYGSYAGLGRSPGPQLEQYHKPSHLLWASTSSRNKAHGIHSKAWVTHFLIIYFTFQGRRDLSKMDGRGGSQAGPMQASLRPDHQQQQAVPQAVHHRWWLLLLGGNRPSLPNPKAQVFIRELLLFAPQELQRQHILAPCSICCSTFLCLRKRIGLIMPKETQA